MNEAQASAKALLTELARELEGIRERLEAAAAGLPELWEDGPEDDAVALRDRLRCVVVDSVTPAIDDLRSAAAALGPGAERR
ncbi:MAG TPA: hypothetical protein VGG03_00685 [Thermoanaerobaculia bacterium]